MSAADDIKRLTLEYACAFGSTTREPGALAAMNTAIDTLQSERDALLEALRRTVAKHDDWVAQMPDVVFDDPLSDAIETGRAAIKKCEEPK
jgi:hypothetical protein